MERVKKHNTLRLRTNNRRGTGSNWPSLRYNSYGIFHLPHERSGPVGAVTSQRGERELGKTQCLPVSGVLGRECGVGKLLQSTLGWMQLSAAQRGGLEAIADTSLEYQLLI